MPSAYLATSSPVIHFAGLSAVSAASDGRSPPDSREDGWRLKYPKGNQNWHINPGSGMYSVEQGNFFSHFNFPSDQPLGILKIGPKLFLCCLRDFRE